MIKMKREAIICDVDNTIIDITHRYHLLKGKDTDWNAFLDEKLIRQDTPIQDTIDVIKALNTRYPILFVTGRNSGIEKITREQIEVFCDLKPAEDLIKAYPYQGYYLFMRDDSDRETPDAAIKKDIYCRFIEPNYKIIAAFDDRPVIVDLWRSLGITTYHVGELATGGGF